MLKIAICDDDLDFLDYFEGLVARSFSEAGRQTNILSFSDGSQLIDKVEKEKHIFDIIFLDIDMPNVNGFLIAQRLRELNPAFILIFTTYLEHQSRKGYLYGAFRYVVKNNLEDEIKEAVTSIIKKLDFYARDHEEITFKCRTLGVLEDLTIQKTDIIFLKLEKNRRVTLKTVHSIHDLLVKPLSEYAKILDPSVFAQVMRCYLLNFNHVEKIEPDYFVLTGGLRVPLGVKREAKKASMEKYLKFLGERI